VFAEINGEKMNEKNIIQKEVLEKLKAIIKNLIIEHFDCAKLQSHERTSKDDEVYSKIKKGRAQQ